MTTASETDLINAVPTDLLINGDWIPASSGKTFTVIDPSTDTVLAAIADATPEDGLHALDSAVAHQEEWAATPPRVRAEILRTAFALLQERKEEFAAHDPRDGQADRRGPG